MPQNSRRVHHTLRHRIIASVSQRLDAITYTQRHGLIRGMRRQGGLGFLPPLLMGGHHETAEHAFFRAHDLTGQVVFELGAFQGILTLFFSSRAKRVIAYEPNPPSYERVLTNLQLNGRGNVEVRNLAVGDSAGTLTLVTDPLMPGGASADPAVAGQIQASSFQGISVTVPVVTLDDDIAAAKLPLPDFIKIDIEGMELPALRGMERTLRTSRPALYMEMHGATMEQKDRNVSAIVEFVRAVGYTSILHVESGEQLSPSTATRGREGHLYCRA